VWRGAIRSQGRTERGGVVPLPKLPKTSGAPVSVFVAFRRDAYEVTRGEITKFNSSPGRWRGFCARCGSPLTCEGEPLSTETHFHIGSIDQAERFQPTRHIFPEERLPWLHLSDSPEQPD
jgi:hypothetical protein